MANPFPTFVPHPFRPFWQPNSQPSSPQDATQLEILTQKLDKAEKTIDKYSRLIASLYAELKRYQDVICHTCRERATAASPSTPTDSTPTSSRPPTNLFEPTVPSSDTSPVCTTIGVQVAAEPFLSLASWEQGRSSVGHLALPVRRSDETGSLILATSSSNNPQATVPYTPSSTIPAIPPYFSDTDSESSQRTVPETTTDVATQPDPDHSEWSVEYNRKIKPRLRLQIVNTLTYETEVSCAKFNRDGKYLAVGLQSGEIHIYDMWTGSKSVLAERSATVFHVDAAEPPSRIWVVRFSLDNKYIATGSSQGHINIWEIGRRRIRATFKHKQAVRCLDLSPDGRFLVSASSDARMCMWNIRDGSRRRSWQGTSDFMSVAFSPDGRYVAAGNNDGFLRIWAARTAQLVAGFKIGYLVWIRSVIFTPDGKEIAIGSGNVECWDISSLTSGHSRTGQMNQIWEFSGHKEYITAISLSSDTRWIVSGSEDHRDNVCILDARSGDWVCTLRAHTSRVWDVDFSPAGHYIVSGGQDRRVRIWRYDAVE